MSQTVASASTRHSRRRFAPVLLLLGIAALVIGLLAATSASGPHALAGGTAAHPAASLAVAAGTHAHATGVIVPGGNHAVIDAHPASSAAAATGQSATGALDCDAVCVLDGIVAALVGLGLALLGLVGAWWAAARPLRVEARRGPTARPGGAALGRPAARPALSALSVLRI